MCKKIRACWGEDVLNAIGKIGGLDGAHDAITQYQFNGSIKSAMVIKGKVSYSNWIHMKAETQ